MNRKLHILLVILLALQLNIHAQTQYRKALKSQESGGNLAISDYTVGVKLGCPWSVMPDSEIEGVTYTGYFGYTFGLVVERHFPRFSVAVEALFSQKGTRMYYDQTYQTSLTEHGTLPHSFILGYNLAAVRIPVTYYFKGTFKDDKVVPYFFIGPQVEIPLPFNATLREGKFVFEDNQALHPNVSAVAGLGLMARIPLDGSAIILKLDVGGGFGVLNLAQEGYTVLPKDKCIRSHTAEANLTVIIPIKRILRDACYYMD